MGDLERSNWILLFVLLGRLSPYVVMFRLFFLLGRGCRIGSSLIAEVG